MWTTRVVDGSSGRSTRYPVLLRLVARVRCVRAGLDGLADQVGLDVTDLAAGLRGGKVTRGDPLEGA